MRSAGTLWRSSAEEYPDALSRLIKRAILIRFNEPNADGVDPSVDLVVTLTRKEGSGVWIPNRDKDDWDASDPECHTRLLTAEPGRLRRHRARVIRLVKAAIKGDSTPALISFNVEALALEHIDGVNGLIYSLQHFFAAASDSIKAGLTEDPAEVSGKIKLPDGITRTRAAKRLGFFAEKIQEAVDAEDREVAESALADLYPDQLPNAKRSAKEALANALRSGDEADIRTGLRDPCRRNDQAGALLRRWRAGVRRPGSRICRCGCASSGGAAAAYPALPAARSAAGRSPHRLRMHGRGRRL